LTYITQYTTRLLGLTLRTRFNSQALVNLTIQTWRRMTFTRVLKVRYILCWLITEK